MPRERVLTFKVSDKGCLSVYGLGVFPVSLYKDQWEALLANIDELKAALEKNADKLKRKGE